MPDQSVFDDGDSRNNVFLHGFIGKSHILAGAAVGATNEQEWEDAFSFPVSQNRQGMEAGKWCQPVYKTNRKKGRVEIVGAMMVGSSSGALKLDQPVNVCAYNYVTEMECRCDEH